MKPVRAKRSLGQNFLIDRSVTARIASAAGIRAGETVIEVGPGRGALTGLLREKADQLICVEKDDALAEELRLRFAGDPGAALVHGDMLDLVASDMPFDGPFRVVANLPYNVAGRITMHLLERWHGQVLGATLMFQREVAQRIAAPAGTSPYGVLSVLVQSFAEVWLLFGVPPRSFRPVPKVQSTVLRLRPLDEPLWATAGLDYEHFRQVVHAGFAARRKRVANSLLIGLSGRLAADGIHAALEQAGIDPGLRPDAVPGDSWVRLAAALATPAP
jgi:16S rRNA (adenine1518-N6/adenine1519-N6)-dimethyltransferase